jgi:hypothetical protein
MTVLVDVNDLDQFVRILTAWHSEKVTALEHMLQVPEGVEVTFQNEKPQALTGDLHKGFIIGLTLGLMELGTLPFLTEYEPNETTPAKPEQLPLLDDECKVVH